MVAEQLHRIKSNAPRPALSHTAKPGKTPIRALLWPLTFFDAEPAADSDDDEQERHTVHVMTITLVAFHIQIDFVASPFDNGVIVAAAVQVHFKQVGYKEMSFILAGPRT